MYSDIIATFYKTLDQTFIEAGIRTEIGRKLESINNLNDYKKLKELKNNILKYVEKHYSDCDLSLTLIGQQFNLSETYLSMFFKEQNGEKFLSYLENKRIQNARKLLNETNCL